MFDCDDEVANRTLELNVKFQVYEWCRICWELFPVLEFFGSHLRSSEREGLAKCHLRSSEIGSHFRSSDWGAILGPRRGIQEIGCHFLSSEGHNPSTKVIAPLSQQVTQHVTIDAKYHNSNAKCHNAKYHTNFDFFCNMSHVFAQNEECHMEIVKIE